MDSRLQQTALVLALLAAAGLLVPTGAAGFLPGQPTDDVGEQVELQPASSEVASLEDEELVVDISASNPNLDAEGLNPNAVTSFDDVFVLHYDGDQYAEVWLTHEGEGVTFATGGASIETRANNVTLGPNESVPVGMTVDTSDPAAIERIDEFTVHARVADPPEADTASVGGWTATAATVTVTSPAPGERLVSIEDGSAGETVEVDLDALALDENDDGALTADALAVDHDAAGDSEFELARVDPAGTDPAVANVTDATGMAALGAVEVTANEDDPVERVRLDLRAADDYLAANDAAGENLAVYRYDGETWHRLAVEHSSTEDGSVLTVATEASGTIVVGTPTAAFDVTATRVNQSEISAGDAVAVTATITNRGAANGTATVPLSLDGTTVDQQTLALGPNESTNVTFTRQLDERGDRTLAIGDSTGVPVQVAAATDVPAASEETTESSTTTQRTETTSEPATTLVEEPAGIGLDRILGLGLVAVLALVTVLLVRRRPLG
ncbi:MAG: CARDB domain-containing protein [Halolamina sp.]